jgi:large subunit ribosomal protein L30
MDETSPFGKASVMSGYPLDETEKKAVEKTLRSLGLRRIGHTVEVKDAVQSRGMLYAVRHLVDVKEERLSPASPPEERRNRTED